MAGGARRLRRSRAFHDGDLSGQCRGQAAAQGRVPRWSSWGSPTPRHALRPTPAKQALEEADRRGRFTAFPTRFASPPVGMRRPAAGARLLLEERQRDDASPHAARRAPAAVDFRRQRLRPRCAPRQAGSGALPACRRGARRPAGECLVVEDAPAGIAAARAGGMAALGVARLGDEALLRAAGADLVVTSLDQVDVGAVAAGECAPARRGGAPDAGCAGADRGTRLGAQPQGYNVLTESAVESRFALGNGFLGMRAARSVSRGPTWVTWLGYISWASWPRCYVAGLFDTPNTEPPVPALVPVADWSACACCSTASRCWRARARCSPARARLDMRRGVLCRVAHATPPGSPSRARAAPPVAGGLRDGAAAPALRAGPGRRRGDAGGQLRDGRLGHGADAAGAGPRRLAHGGHRQGRGDGRRRVAATRRRSARARPAVPAALGVALALRGRAGGELDRLVAVARADTRADDPAPPALDALARSRALGWRAVLAAHEAAWEDALDGSEVGIEGDDDLQQALRFAVYHLSSAANPEDERVSIGARGLTGDAYFGHVFWDTEIYLLPFYTATWPEAARALLMYRFHTLPGARAKAAQMGCRGALYAWESADTGEETTPERVVAPDGGWSTSCRHGGAPHQRRRRLRRLAVLAGDRRRRLPPAGRRRDPAGDGPVLGVARRGGGGRQAAHPPRHRAGRVPRGRGRQRLHQRDGALEHRPRARDAGPAARALARPCRRAAGEAGARRGRARGLARCGRAHRDRPRSGDRPVRAVRRLLRSGADRPRRLRATSPSRWTWCWAASARGARRW